MIEAFVMPDEFRGLIPFSFSETTRRLDQLWR
jgi:hypothetical protein